MRMDGKSPKSTDVLLFKKAIPKAINQSFFRNPSRKKTKVLREPTSFLGPMPYIKAGTLVMLRIELDYLELLKAISSLVSFLFLHSNLSPGCESFYKFWIVDDTVEGLWTSQWEYGLL